MFERDLIVACLSFVGDLGDIKKSGKPVSRFSAFLGYGLWKVGGVILKLFFRTKCLSPTKSFVSPNF